jgi:hypothetical protein
MRARWLVVSLVALAAASSPAFAQSVSVQAQSLFNEGRSLLQAGKVAEACAAFESSEKLEPAVTTLLNLAACREQNHQLATAWGTFVDANRMARTASNNKLAGVANSHAAKLEPRLSKLTIAVPADRRVPGLEVLRDNEPVNPAGWNHALPIDGGTYTITARAPGHAPWSATTRIKVESDAQSVEIPKLAEARPGAPVAATRTGTPGAAPTTTAPASATPRPAAPATTAPAPATPRPAAPPPAAPTPVASAHPAPLPAVPAGNAGGAPSVAKAGAVPPVTTPGPGSAGGAPSSAPGARGARGARSVAEATPSPAAAPVTPPEVDQPASSRSYRWPITFGAGALVLGGAALGFDLWGNHTYDQAKQETIDQPRRSSLESSANTRRYLAEGLGIAAIGCAGAAVYFYLRGRGEGHAEATATALTPVASRQFSGLAVVGHW